MEENIYGELDSLVLGADAFVTALFANWQGAACLWDKGPSLTKEVVCWHLFMSTEIRFKTFLVEREPNLEASSFLEATLPNGQPRLSCINGDSF